MTDKKEETEEKEVKPETTKEEYKLVEVPSEYRLAIQTPDKEILSTEQAMVLLLNKVEEIKKVVG